MDLVIGDPYANWLTISYGAKNLSITSGWAGGAGGGDYRTQVITVKLDRVRELSQYLQVVADRIDGIAS